MRIILKDYANRLVPVELGPEEDIGAIEIKVVTGDEIAVVIDKLYRIREYDSSNCRNYDYADYSFPVYNSATGFKDERFFSRNDSVPADDIQWYSEEYDEGY